MNGKKIEISLHTPIILRQGEVEVEKPREEAVFRISGKVESFSESGVLVDVSEMIGSKNNKITPIYSTVFIPIHKIDHIFVVS